jgi:hypothetical protein
MELRRDLNVGGVEVRFLAGDRAVVDGLGAAWGPCPPAGREPDLIVEYEVGGRADRGLITFVADSDGVGRVSLVRDDLDGVVEAGTPARARFRGAAIASLADSAVLQAIGMAVPCMGGVIFHSAAVADERGALIFNGKSGAGKTTISGLLEGQFPMSLGDENIAVLPAAGAWIAHAIPFLRHGVVSASAPLRAIFLLRKAERNRVARATPSRALAEIVPNTRTWLPARALAIVSELLQTTPVFELEFSLEPGAGPLRDLLAAV